MAVPLHMHSGFPVERLEQAIITSLYDVKRVSRAIVGGNYKRRALPSLEAAAATAVLSSGCFSTSV